jgi:PPOX class probable F420-dependent enzyme
LSRRDQIRMSESELRQFLDASKTMILCSVSAAGFPHPMPMWFGVEDDGTVVMTTFTKSQKIRNLERDPRVSLLVEDGEEYAELRGAVIYGRAELVRDDEKVVDILERVTARSGATSGAEPGEVRKALLGTARKRTGIRVAPTKVVSWDHRKLAGAY